MPRLTDASRLARRDAIADAAIRVLKRQGVAHTSIADIVEELGGSAGGVYSHFESKAEIVQHIASGVFSNRTDVLTELGDRRASPETVLRAALGGIASETPTALIVQLWGEATVDPEMRTIVAETLAEIEQALRAAILPWSYTRPGDPESRADRAARTMRAISQGYIAQLALFDAPDADAYVDAIASLFD